MTKLAHWIRQQLQTKSANSIPFAQFMEWALYHPTMGYYQTSSVKIGKKGDYYTNSHVGAIFGEILARFFNQLADTFGGEKWAVAEFGAGDGKLAHDLLNGLKQHRGNKTLDAYYIIEKSHYHRKLMKGRFDHDQRVHWVNDFSQALAQQPLVVLSNELIDAMPVHRLRYEDGAWHELYAVWDSTRQCFRERPGDYSCEALRQYVDVEQPPRVERQTIEVNLNAHDWMKQIGTVMQEGYVITIDYGYLKGALWDTVRRNGTLMCFDRHRAHADPFVRIGEQDMTTHVNFSSLCRWGQMYGLSAEAFTTQADFLRRAGILDELRDHQDPNPFSEAARRNRAIRQLIAPGGMGDTFKVLLQKKRV